MFDLRSRLLLRDAPELIDLDPKTLDELLTAAHVELATARISAQNEAEPSAEIFTRVRRLASTFEAYVALDLRPEQMRAAAFVAGTAHQILALLRNTRPDQPTLLSSDAVDSTISATVLFLIADRAADAAEVATRLSARDEPRAIRRALILSIRDFATGRLEDLSYRRLLMNAAMVGESREQATDLLVLECAKAIRNLAREARRTTVGSMNVRKRLRHVIKLSGAISDQLPGNLTGFVHHQFAGPHHLASLMLRMVQGVRVLALIEN